MTDDASFLNLFLQPVAAYLAGEAPTFLADARTMNLAFPWK